MKHPSLLSERDFPDQNGFHTFDSTDSTRPSAANGYLNHRATRRFAPGALVFLEGDECQGALILRRGRVKLSVEHSAGRSITVAIAQPGDIIGLAACFAQKMHETTAEVLDACEAEYITRDGLLRLIDEDKVFALSAMRQLSTGYVCVCEKLASISGADPVIVRLARLFAGWAPERNGHRSLCLETRFTHQQMAEMIGTTRETVTRSLTEMRNRGLATLRNGALSIHDHDRLLLLAANGTELL